MRGLMRVQAITVDEIQQDSVYKYLGVAQLILSAQKPL